MNIRDQVLISINNRLYERTGKTICAYKVKCDYSVTSRKILQKDFITSYSCTSETHAKDLMDDLYYGEYDGG